MNPPRLCLVTPSHVASNPRLVKEADALQAAGYAVHVVAHRYFSTLDQDDAAIYAGAKWTHSVVDSTTGLTSYSSKFRRRLLRIALRRGLPLNPRRAGNAHHHAIEALATVAMRTGAQLYIGHCLAGLAAAAIAARRTGALYGFDAEDFHRAETDFVEQDPQEQAIVTALEEAYLPGCRHFTAASPLIGQAYAGSCGITLPNTVLNVFPLSESPPAPVRRPRPTTEHPARIYWFSQTIGPGRGLEEILPVLAAMRTPVELHLRGFISPEYRKLLNQAASQAGLVRPPVYHDFAPMSAMVRLAADYDLGLSLEASRPKNRDLCLTNKIFTYVLAGLPQLVSPTSAHHALAADLGPAAIVADLQNPDVLAARLDAWFADCASVEAARSHAWHLGQTRYNWEYEQKALIASVTSIA